VLGAAELPRCKLAIGGDRVKQTNGVMAAILVDASRSEAARKAILGSRQPQDSPNETPNQKLIGLIEAVISTFCEIA
jgi:hypothetical protein